MAPEAPKLSRTNRAELLTRYAAGESIAHLALDYKISESYVRKICTRRVAVPTVRSEGKEQSYRENLAWAIGTAGEFLRTAVRPIKCPNDAAWFLYMQAINEPKDFMAKFSQVEAKLDTGESERAMRQSGRRSIQEIDSMLAELGEESK